MADRLKRMSGKKFMFELLRGHTILEGIKLPLNTDLKNVDRELYGDLGQVFGRMGFDETYFMSINESSLEGLRAKHLYLPHLRVLGTNLSGANLSYANLESAFFTKGNLSDAILAFARLEGATFINANLNEAEFYRANMSRANLTEAVCEKTSFVESTLKDALFGGAHLEGANFEKANLRGANFGRAYFGSSGASFIGADLRGAKNLELATSLNNSEFVETIVTPKEQAIIEPCLLARRLIIKELPKE